MRGNETTLKIERENTHRSARSITRVISFTSGKGGVGKTNTVVNVAMALSRLGRRVLVLDADLSLANVDVLLGLSVKHTIEDFLSGTHSLEEVMLDGPEGISIIPAASGVERMSSLSTAQRLTLNDAIEGIAEKFDYLLIDTQAGIGAEVMYFNSASAEVVCVINPEPTSLTDAYALIKILSRNYGERSISILSNNVSSEQEGMSCFDKLARASLRFLHINLKYLGAVPTDGAVRAAIREQRPLLNIFPSSAAGMALSSLANRIDSDFLERRVKGGMQFFFKQLLEVSANGR